MENTLEAKSPQSNNSRPVERIESNEIFTKVRSNSRDSQNDRFHDRERQHSNERRRYNHRRENSAENKGKNYLSR